MRRDIDTFERGRVKIVEIVNDRNAPGFFGKQAFNQMRADEPRAAGDENVFMIFHEIVKGMKSCSQIKITRLKIVWQNI